MYQHLNIGQTSEASLLNKSSCLALTLGVTKFISVTYVILELKNVAIVEIPKVPFT
jgi:hypothetical protein